MGSLRKSLILLGLLLLSTACKGIVVKVTKKDRSDAIHSVTRSSEDSQREPRIQDLEYYLFNLDELRNVSGEALYERLKDNWRHIFRREFRNFRQVLINTALKPHRYSSGMAQDLSGEECRALEHVDLRTFEGHQFLEILLEASFLANLYEKEAIKLNPSLADRLDVIVHLILFELGMRGNGTSSVEVDGTSTKMSSAISWKVDPEITDPDEFIENDSYGVRMNFTRSLQRSRSDAFSLQVEMAKELFDKPDIQPEYRLFLEHRWFQHDTNGDRLEIEMKIWHDQDIVYSRLIALEQTARFSEVYIARDLIYYELEEEELREAIVDFARLRKCAMSTIDMMVPGLMGMNLEDATRLLRALQLRVGEVEYLDTASDELIVVRQDPMPGALVDPGSPVDMIMGQWADLPLPEQVNDNIGEDPPTEEPESDDASMEP